MGILQTVWLTNRDKDSIFTFTSLCPTPVIPAYASCLLAALRSNTGQIISLNLADAQNHTYRQMEELSLTFLSTPPPPYTPFRDLSLSCISPAMAGRSVSSLLCGNGKPQYCVGADCGLIINDYQRCTGRGGGTAQARNAQQ